MKLTRLADETDDESDEIGSHEEFDMKTSHETMTR